MQISRRDFMALTAAGTTVTTFGLPAFAASKGTIGIAMPTKSSTRWIHDGESMEEQSRQRAMTLTGNMPRMTSRRS